MDINTLSVKVKDKIKRASIQIIKTDGDYDRKTTTLAFPKKWSKKMIKYWLIQNHYPIENEYYHITSMYDCTGEVHTVYVDYKKNHVTFTECYDV